MQVEHSVKVFPLDQDLESNIQKMTAEGWLLMPGVTPVAIYHTVRLQGVLPADEGTAKGVVAINIDDTKVKILRDGVLIDAA